MKNHPVAKSVTNTKGQGVLEYVILTSLIGVLCLGAVRTMGTRMNTKINQMTQKVQDIEIR